MQVLPLQLMYRPLRVHFFANGPSSGVVLANHPSSGLSENPVSDATGTAFSSRSVSRTTNQDR
eukprot:6203189-Pleurochrysis_carterae.AAC.1